MAEGKGRRLSREGGKEGGGNRLAEQERGERGGLVKTVESGEDRGRLRYR